jgi:ribosomal protein S18 acetylase RimI-like enzyme
VALRPSTASDLGFITALERHPDNRDLIGQWSDAEHLDAIAGRDGREHWIIERDGRPAGYLIAYDCRAHAAGIYVKRILVADKERGTGRAALATFLDAAFARPGVDCAWLNVRAGNFRAQAVYRKLGFTRFDPVGEEAARYDAAGQRPIDQDFRMRLALETWRARAG